MPLFQIILLAIVQGTTEFLPISSSGHIVIVAALLAPDGNVAALDVTEVNVALHVGTLGSILVFYWQRLWRLFSEDRHVVGLLIVGTIPAAVAGAVIKLAAENVLQNVLLAGCMLLVTATFLLWTARLPVGQQPYRTMGYSTSLVIGISQAFALLPGISRSGATICAGLSLGLSRRDAAAYSFLLAIPAIAGASTLEIYRSVRESTAVESQESVPTKSPRSDPLSQGPDTSAAASAQDTADEPLPAGSPPPDLAIGALVAFVVGLGALSLLVRWLERGRLHYFAYWCYAVGTLVILWQLAGRST